MREQAMRTDHPKKFSLAVRVLRPWAASGALAALLACQPSLLDVGGVLPAESSTPDAAPPPRDAQQRDTAMPQDAAAPPPQDAGDPVIQETGLTVCQDIRAPGDLVDIWVGPVTTRSLEQFSCETAFGEPLTSGVYFMRDGGVLLRAGETYSLSWKDAAVHSLRLSGGAQPCDTGELYREVLPGPHFAPPQLPAPACRELTPSVDMTYLRIPRDDFTIYFPPLKLCPSPCPEVDAGM